MGAVSDFTPDPAGTFCYMFPSTLQSGSFTDSLLSADLQPFLPPTHVTSPSLSANDSTPTDRESTSHTMITTSSSRRQPLEPGLPPDTPRPPPSWLRWKFPSCSPSPCLTFGSQTLLLSQGSRSCQFRPHSSLFTFPFLLNPFININK